MKCFDRRKIKNEWDSQSVFKSRVCDLQGQWVGK